MTVALAVILLGALMLYCGVKGKSFRQALLGHALDASSGGLLDGTGSGSGSSPQSSPAGNSAPPGVRGPAR